MVLKADAISAIDPYIVALPKAELHLHLEGAVEPETVVELARNHGEELDPEAVRKMFHYTDFTGFLLCFREITRQLRGPEDYELITYRMMERLKQQNVLHAEVYMSVGTCIWWGHDFDEVFEGLERGRQKGECDFGMSLYWLFDAVRHFGAERAMAVAEYAVKLRERGSVIGIGIGGDERRAGPELFQDVYAYAAANGMRLTCHAGEAVGPESVWGALKLLKTERIGHGTRSHEDPSLMAHLRETQTPVEVSVSSNLRTGCVPRLEEHPVRKFWDAGLMVTLNTDDPAMFETTIGREYQIAKDVFGFTNDELKRAAMNSFRASFLPAHKKDEFLARFNGKVVGR